MLELTVLLIVGLVLAVLFVSWAVRLGTRDFEVPPAQVGELTQFVPLVGILYERVEELFDARDYGFLTQLRLHEVARKLEWDRRRAALHWLKLMREDFHKLQEFRRLLMACGAGTNPRTEWILFVSSVSFHFLHGFLTFWVRVFGLYTVPRGHAALVRLAREVYSHAGCALARLSPSQLTEVRQRWALRRSATTGWG